MICGNTCSLVNCIDDAQMSDHDHGSERRARQQQVAQIEHLRNDSSKLSFCSRSVMTSVRFMPNVPSATLQKRSRNDEKMESEIAGSVVALHTEGSVTAIQESCTEAAHEVSSSALVYAYRAQNSFAML